MKLNKENIEQLFVQSLVDDLPTIPRRCAVPCSVSLNKKIIGGIFLTLNQKDFKFFNISEENPPEPNIKYRMLDIERKNYLLEIVLSFSHGKTLLIHLNPSTPPVSRLLRLLIKSKFIGFHYFNSKNEKQLSSYIDVDDDELEWVKRNLKICDNLKQNDDYDLVCNTRLRDTDKKSIIFDFWYDSTVDCFIPENSIKTRFLNFF